MNLVPRRRMLGLLAAGGAMAGVGVVRAPGASAAPVDWTAAAADVKAEFRWAWQNYVARAFGKDQIKPVSGGSEDFFVPGHSVGLTIVEALDTLWLMGLDAELQQGVNWVKANLRFNINASFQVFETNIRLVGGLLSGYHVTGDARLLALAKDLADRLLPAFTKSPTGLPYRFVNLRTAAVSGPETNLAEIGTYIAEFGVLSQWTGDQKYFNAAKNALRAAFNRRTSLNLLPYAIHAETGARLNTTATIGPPADSFYEYLWDGFALFGDADLKTWYTTLTTAIVAHQAETVGGRLWFGAVDATTGRITSRGQSELAAFYAGLLAEGGDLTRGRAYHDSWNAVQDRYGVLPEGIDYTTLNATSKGNQLRPEFADAALTLWLKTRDELYRQRAYTHYLKMKQTSKVAFGYTILNDVTTGARGDSCPGYWWSEQTKYYWLLFSDTPRFNYTNNYLSTEGNVLRGAQR
jgi:mannosyl-oligosaccharide alpha-1,2-mannosidase